MKTFTRKAIHDLEKIYRINLINSCTGYKSANLIATMNEQGIYNVAVFSSVTHLGSNPPFVGFVTRPPTVDRHTIFNIRKTKQYTINSVFQSVLFDAHHTSAKYNEAVSEFDMTNLETELKENIEVPFVKNAPVQLLMEPAEEIPIQSNDTILVVGAVKALYVHDHLLKEDGFIELDKGKVATINGLDGYAVPQLSERFSYQRPKETANE